MRLIDADALIRECEEELKDESLWHDEDTTKDYAEGNDDGKRIIMTIIDSAPTIEPKRGEWEDIDNWWESNEEIHLFRCSVCGAEMNSPIEPNFCCSCGADMRKETVDYKRVVLTCDDEGNWSMCGERKEGE